MPTTIAPEARLSPYLPSSLAVNGDFEIWQRGNGPFVATGLPNGIVGADEWNCGVSGLGVASIQRAAGAKVGNYCLQLNFDGVGAGAGVVQPVEAYKSLVDLPLTASIWVKTTVAGVVRGYVQGYNGATHTTGLSSFHTGSGNWERLTAIATMPSVLVADPNAHPHNYGVTFGLACYSTVPIVVYMDGAALVVGNYPEGVPFVPVHPADDWQRCQRFYQKGSDEWSSIIGRSTPTVDFFQGSRTPLYPVRMAAVPTITSSNFQVSLYNKNTDPGTAPVLGDQANWTLTLSRNTEDGHWFTATRNSPAPGHEGVHDVGNASCDWTAEVP